MLIGKKFFYSCNDYFIIQQPAQASSRTIFNHTTVRHFINQMVDGSGKELISRINKPEKPQIRRNNGRTCIPWLSKDYQINYCHESI